MRPLRSASTCLLLVLALVVGAPASQASTWVEKAQRRLDALGCAAGPVDGRAGIRTRAAALRFQSANGLRQSGRLTDRTRARLYAARQVRCDARPVPGAATGRRIVISQRQNWVWLVRAGGSVALQAGIVDNPDVLGRGTYRTGSKCGRAARIRANTDLGGSLWLHNFVRFAPCGIGFHRIPQLKSSGAQIHRDFLLGTNLRESHGCIRVSRATSKRIWDFARVGTRVVVVR
jgi:hypothetical protein